MNRWKTESMHGRRRCRRVRTSVAGLLVAGLLVGCGGGDGEGASTDGVADASGTAADASAVVDAAWTSGDTADGTWSISWRPVDGEIPPLDPFSVEVVVRSPSGGPVPEDVSVLVDATMPHHGHGMNVEPRVTRTDPGDGEARFLAEGMLLHMPGRWEFTVDVLRGGEVERAQWTVTLDD